MPQSRQEKCKISKTARATTKWIPDFPTLLAESVAASVAPDQITHMTERPPQFDPPVTQWLQLLEKGNATAAQQLWEHFCRKLMQHASGRLNERLRPSYDEEDAALSAFRSMCRMISDGRQQDLTNRNNLWRLLVVITERKILGRIKYENRDRRDIRRTLSEAILEGDASGSSTLQGLPCREPSPEFSVEFTDTLSALLDSLEDDQLREIVQLRLTDHENEEIAMKLKITRRTVERKLLRIRARWEQLANE